MKTAKKRFTSLALAGALAAGSVLASQNNAGAALPPDRSQSLASANGRVQVFPAAILAGAVIAVAGFVAKELYEEGKAEGAHDARKRHAQRPPDAGVPVFASALD
jgi:hypothetical protein